MRFALFAVLVGLIRPASLPITPNLTGLWIEDAAKPRAGIPKTSMRLVLEIQQEGGQLQIVWLMRTDEGQKVWIQNLVLEHEEQAGIPSQQVVVTGPQGTLWVLDSLLPAPNPIASAFVRWSFATDGSTLVLHRDLSALNGEVPEEVVLRRTTEIVNLKSGHQPAVRRYQ